MEIYLNVFGEYVFYIPRLEIYLNVFGEYVFYIPIGPKVTYNTEIINIKLEPIEIKHKKFNLKESESIEIKQKGIKKQMFT